MIYFVNYDVNGFRSLLFSRVLYLLSAARAFKSVQKVIALVEKNEKIVKKWTTI
jgi:hypothetical protein